jgi:hypothetical protein
MADTTRSEPPRLHIVRHEASLPRHTGIGEYQVTVNLQVEMVNAEKEMVHAQFLVDGSERTKVRKVSQRLLSVRRTLNLQGRDFHRLHNRPLSSVTSC